MKTTTFTALISLAAAVIAAPAFAQSQTPAPSTPLQQPHTPLQKSIGSTTKNVVYPSLIVLNSKGAQLAGGKLVLAGVSPNAIVFADRPYRAAGHANTNHVLEDWLPGESFAKDPPNATVSAFSKEGNTVKDAVVTLKTPKLEGDKLTFDVEVLEGDLNGADGAASIFIDIIGLPFTPLSYAGVARRTAYRAAWYGGAAAAGAAAAGAVAAGAAAAAVARPYPYYPPPACGYYPYPPCY